ncbi:MAG: PKD domain-containing protein [Bacteroidia bacterium]|nr:PKD domain-containing protein [Bacteroidia bacterium]
MNNFYSSAKKIIVFVFLLMVTLAQGQNSTFIRLAQVPGLNFGLSFSPTADGGFVTTGQDNGVGGHGDCDTYVMKVDECGVTEWYYRYGDVGGDGGKTVKQTSDGGFIVSGLTAYGGGVPWNIFVMKLDALGNFQWLRAFDSGVNDYGLGVAEAPNGDFVVSGFNGVGGQLPFVARVSATGALLWEKQYGLTGAWGNNVEVLPSGEIMFTGSYSGPTANWNVFVLKLSAIGNVIWGYDYNTGGTDGLDWDVNSQLTADGGMIVGFSSDLAMNGDYQTQIMKLDPSAVVQWSSAVGVTGVSDRSHFVSQTQDGGYIQTGFNGATAASLSILNKFDKNGVHKYTKHYGQPGTVNKAWGARETSDRGILICAESTGYGADDYDPLFIKTDSLGEAPNCALITPVVVTSNPAIIRTDISATTATPTGYDKGTFVSTRLTVLPTEILVCQNCSNKPKAAFSDTIVCVNDTIKVYNKTSTGIICQQRIASIDSTSASAPTFQQAKDTSYFRYSIPGIYYITIDAPCANNSAGSVMYQKIIVKPLPVANFTIGNTCNDKPIANTDASVGSVPAIPFVTITKWDWNFGDATTHSITQNPTHTYTTNGAHTTTLIVENSIGCKDTVVKTLYVHDVPKTVMSGVSKCLYKSALTTGLVLVPSDSLLFNSMATIAPSDILTKYEWDFEKDGTIDLTKVDSTQKLTQNKLYTAASNYWVKLKVSTAYCSKTDSININIYPNPTADITVQNVCADSAIQITDISTLSNALASPIVPTPTINLLAFDYGDGSAPYTTPYPPSSPIQHQYLVPGKYAIRQVVSTANMCYAVNMLDTALVYPEPIANFLMNDTCLTKLTTLQPITTSSSVPVTAGSTNTVVSWIWDYTNNNIKDAVNGTNVSVSTTYANVDTSKYASLVVRTNHGCVDSIAKKIVVHPNPVANFTSQAICFPRASVFTNLSTIQSGTVTSNNWTFDATGKSILQNPSYTYLFPNTHSVKLVVTSNYGCKDSVTKTAQVFPLPTANLLTRAVCKDSAITILDQSSVNNALPNPIVPAPIIDSIYFVYGDNTVPTQLKMPNALATHLYTAAGKYYITQLVKSNNGCYMLHKDSVVIYPRPVVGFTMSEACIQQPTTFTPTAVVTNAAGSTSTITNWYWDYTSNVNVETNNTTNANVLHTYPSADTNKFATLVVKTNYGCKDSIAKKIIVHPNPEVSFMVDEVCLGAPSEFENLTTILQNNTFTNKWIFTPINSSIDLNTSYTYTAPNNYQVKLIVTSNFSCKDSLTQTATVNPNPIVDFDIAPKVVCQPDYVTYTEMASIGTVPAGSFNTDFKWKIGNEPELQGIQGKILLRDTGNYDVTLTVYTNKNCFAFKTVPNLVRVNLKPTALFSVNPTVTSMLNPIITISDLSINGAIYNWSTGDTIFSTFGKVISFLHTYKDTGTYTIIQLVKTNKGCTDTMKTTVIIKANWTIFVPNSFTPDGDGINEYFNARGTGLLVYKLRIYDRWGQVVGLVENITSKGWDGTDISNGAKSKSDVYTWSLDFSDINGYEQKRVGTVTLMR